jgi:hypothetical protein
MICLYLFSALLVESLMVMAEGAALKRSRDEGGEREEQEQEKEKKAKQEQDEDEDEDEDEDDNAEQEDKFSAK